MKPIVFSVLAIILSSALLVPIGYSHAEDENKTSTNQTGSTQMNMMNQTGANQTGKVNIGQEISYFIHESNQQFKNQKAETLGAIKEYHEKLQNATSSTIGQIRADFKAKMQSIREKYQNERKQFQDIFKQFREEVMLLRDEAQGKQVSTQDEDNAIKHINEKGEKEGLKHMADLEERSKGMSEHGVNGTMTAIRHMNETGNENMSSSGGYQEGKGEHGMSSGGNERGKQ